MHYKPIEEVRTARDEALQKSDFWFALDTPYLIDERHVVYRDDLRYLPSKIYAVDEAYVKDSDGNLQQSDGVVLELPAVPSLDRKGGNERPLSETFGIVYEQRY